jgi:hypothetical protein
MKNKEEFISAISSLFYDWGSDTPDEVFWGCNELLDWYEKEYNVQLNIRFERDDDYECNYEDVIQAIKNN